MSGDCAPKTSACRSVIVATNPGEYLVPCSVMRKVWTGLCLLLLLHNLSSVHGKTRKPRPRRELLPPETGPTDEQIFETGLIEKSVSAATLYEKSQQYYSDVSIKRFNGPILGYVTPWNSRGYEFAVLFRAKLTHVSPVWYQLKRKDSKDWVLEGSHEYNKTWVQAVQEPVTEDAVPTKVVPRVIVELTQPQDHVSLVTDSSRTVVDLLANEVQDKGYDGLVLEVWMTWVYMNAIANEEFATYALAFIKALHTRLHDQQAQLILAVPPPVPQGYSRPFIEKNHLQSFGPYVDFWSIMTYDYAIGSGPRPNSPLHWLQSQIKVLSGETGEGPVLRQPHQALMGVNFYGYDFSKREEGQVEAVVADKFMSLLKHQPGLEWHEDHGEHSFEYKAMDGWHQVFYPTPRALQLRIEFFMKHGVGISIWELGQGLPRFFDLL